MNDHDSLFPSDRRDQIRQALDTLPWGSEPRLALPSSFSDEQLNAIGLLLEFAHEVGHEHADEAVAVKVRMSSLDEYTMGVTVDSPKGLTLTATAAVLAYVLYDSLGDERTPDLPAVRACLHAHLPDLVDAANSEIDAQTDED